MNEKISGMNEKINMVVTNVSGMNRVVTDVKYSLRTVTPTLVDFSALKFSKWWDTSTQSSSKTNKQSGSTKDTSTADTSTKSADTSTQNASVADTSTQKTSSENKTHSKSALKQQKAEEGIRELKLNLSKTICQHIVDYKITCMITGEVESQRDGWNTVRCAHIIPHRMRSETASLAQIGYTYLDVDHARNGLFVLEGFEIAFDKKYLGFCRSKNTLRNRIVVRVFDKEACSKIPIYRGSLQFVDEYHNFELNLVFGEYEHKPWKTALHLHVIMCLLQLRKSGKEIPSDIIKYVTENELSSERKTPLIAEFTLEISESFTAMAESFRARLEEESDENDGHEKNES